MPNNDWITGYLQKQNAVDPINTFRKALLGLKGNVDTAANYYSGLPDALNPNKPPVPLEDLASEALFPGSTERGNIDSTPRAMASSAVNAILGTAGDPLSYGGGGKGSGIPGAGILNEEGENVAFHGTPHDFDVFDSSKIGTGEGAQSYGHGMYFADDPNIAESYRKRLSGDKLGSREKGNLIGAKIPPPDKFLDYDATLKDLPPHIADVLPETDMARRYEDNYTKAMHDVEASLPYLSKYGYVPEIENAVNQFKSGKIPPSAMHDPMADAWVPESSEGKTRFEGEVEPITSNMYRFNSPAVRDALGIDPTKLSNELFGAYAGPTPDMPVSSIDLGPEGVQRLNEKGIAGVKYADANSRGYVFPGQAKLAAKHGLPPAPEPKYNYVVFNPEKDAQIKGKLPSPNKEQISDFLRNIMKIRPY